MSPRLTSRVDGPGRFDVRQGAFQHSNSRRTVRLEECRLGQRTGHGWSRAPRPCRHNVPGYDIRRRATLQAHWGADRYPQSGPRSATETFTVRLDQVLHVWLLRSLRSLRLMARSARCDVRREAAVFVGPGEMTVSTNQLGSPPVSSAPPADRRREHRGADRAWLHDPVLTGLDR